MMDIKKNILTTINSLSVDALNIFAIICVHCASIPTLLSVLTGINDNPPPVDIFLFVFSGLFLMLLRSIIQKDSFTVLLNSFGFAVQVILLSLIVFK